MTRKTKKLAVTIIGGLTLNIFFQNCSNPLIIAKPSTDPHLQDYIHPDISELNKSFKANYDDSTTLKQKLIQNIMTVKFRVEGDKSVPLSQIVLKENGYLVDSYNLVANSTTELKKVDIGLVVDTTGSMRSTLESMKLRLTAFVNTLYNSKQEARFCISTFADRVVTACNKFYNLEPNNPENISEKNSLLNAISQLDVQEGGGDTPENPLHAILEILKADWTSDHQKFIILVTDASFHYSPSFEGDAGALAPQYKDVLATLSKTDVTIFGATPDLDGYNKSFSASGGTQPGIIPATDGEWFSYSALVRGEINFDTILNKIVSRIASTYTLSYTIDSTTNTHLNQDKALAARDVTVQTTDPTTVVKGVTVASTMPNGAKDLPSTFVVSNKDIEPVVQVSVNKGAPTTMNANNGKITFASPPSAGAAIKFSFKYKNAKDAFNITPTVFAHTLDLELVAVKINGLPVNKADYELVRMLEGNLALYLKPSIFEMERYNIISSGVINLNISGIKYMPSM